MADGVVVRTNLPDFKRQLAALGQEFERKTMNGAAKAAANIFKRALIAKAPVRSGTLARSFYVKLSRDSTSGRAHFFVAFRQGKRFRARAGTRKGKTVAIANKDAFYGRFLEEGWIPRSPGNALRGGIREKAFQRARSSSRRISRPFVGPAFRASKDEALRAFTMRVERDIAKASKR